MAISSQCKVIKNQSEQADARGVE